MNLNKKHISLIVITTITTVLYLTIINVQPVEAEDIITIQTTSTEATTEVTETLTEDIVETTIETTTPSFIMYSGYVGNPTVTPTPTATPVPTAAPTLAPVIVEQPVETTVAQPTEIQPTETTIATTGCLTRRGGVYNGPSGRETYYNLNMSGIVQIMRDLGYSEEDYPYWVREDGCKMFGDYIMVAANLSIRPRGTILETSLGTAIVCDTGTFIYTYPNGIDIATNW